MTSSTSPTTAAPSQVARLKDLTPTQWKTGIAAWLGWLFDGLDMHLYTLAAAPFVSLLLNNAEQTSELVKHRAGWIQAAFLVGWALGGGFFGRIGDRLGRSRALCLTVLTYAIFTGLSTFAGTWWHLLIFRFLAALGIGGEWAVGSSLLSETWPRQWRPWIAAVLQTGVNIGVLIAYMAYALISPISLRGLFLVGVLPALLVFWIRRAVPEPEEWKSAKTRSEHHEPGTAALFARGLRRTTLLTVLLCGLSLTGWWAFLFWIPQHVRHLPDVTSLAKDVREIRVFWVSFLIILISIGGNFFGGALAKYIGYRWAIAANFLLAVIGFIGAFSVPHGYFALLPWVLLIGFSSGVFGLFTMYLPPLFPTLLRTTGAGFCYNIGRIIAAGGTVVFGILSTVGNFQIALLLDGLLFVPAMFIALLMPEGER